MLMSLAGRKLEMVPAPLESIITELSNQKAAHANAIELALRMNVAAASDRAITVVSDRAATGADRIALMKALGETRLTAAIEPLLALLGQSETEPLQTAALGALGYFDDDRIADAVLNCFARLGAGSQARAVDLLCSRANSARKLLEAIERKEIAPEVVSLNQLRQLTEMKDERLLELIAKNWGRVQTTTPLEKQGRITAVLQMLLRGPGDPTRGREHFTKICATCHKLHDKGESIGPDLTGADRKNREVLVRNIIDPSAMVREQYITHIAATTDGRILTGLLAESTADTITLVDTQNKRTVLNRADVEALQESSNSFMPEKLLDPLNEQQIRDLFAYLQGEVDLP
jgi:putative heme-binding domain-containing protein